MGVLKALSILPTDSSSPGESRPDLRVITGDFVTTGMYGIVHIAPTFGADDARVARNGCSCFGSPTRPEHPAHLDRTGKFFVWRIWILLIVDRSVG
jgi:isoleucyl-tRNA synthetase